MRLDDLKKEIKEDFPIDKTDLGIESLKSSKLFVKYIEIYSDENLAMKKMKSDRAKIVSKLREYYSGQAGAETYFKDRPTYAGPRPKTEAGLQKCIENDETLITFDESILVQEQKVEVLVNCLEEIKRRGYAIRAAIDYQKFINGA